MRAPPERLQWVRYEFGPALLALTRVSVPAELAHRRLSEFYWQTGEWPTTVRGQAAALSRVAEDQWPGVLEELAALGWRERSGRLRHREAYRVRAEALGFLGQARQNGRHGAQRRWKKAPAAPKRAGPDRPPNEDPNGDPNSDPIGDPNGHPIGDPIAINSNSSSKSKQDSTVHNTLNEAERLTFSGSARKESSGVENDFLEEVSQTMAAFTPDAARTELANWGGWWRNRFRESPDKARRVLADIRSMVRERRITQNPGAAAADLWKRLP
jgi:hypothetical protein